MGFHSVPSLPVPEPVMLRYVQHPLMNVNDP